MKSRPLLVTVVLSALLIWPLLPWVAYDFIDTAILACYYLMAVLSLVLLIGMVGQISLAQATFVGMGAFVSALAIHHLGLHFPFVLLVGAIAGAVTATMIGVVALRVRGLYLAVATLILAYVADQYLFVQTWLVGSQSGTSIRPEVIGQPGALPYMDLGDAHMFYYVALAVAGFALYSLANLRESRVGRAFAAIRGSEVAAASLGIDVVRFKLLGFAVAGGLAGLGGSLTLLGQRAVAPDQFNFIASLYFLAIAVVGGLRSLGGAIVSSLLFALLVGEVFFRFPTLADYLDVISAVILIGVLLFFRGGLGALPERLAAFWARLQPGVNATTAVLQTLTEPLRRVVARLGSGLKGLNIRGRLQALTPRFRRSTAEQDVAGESETSAPGALDVVGIATALMPKQPSARVLQLEPTEVTTRPSVPETTISALRSAAGHVGRVAGESTPEGRRGPVLLSAERITVRFGGLTAVSEASLRVGAGEIVGLIGPNGAGKTTLFNSILGLNEPTEGKVEIFGRDVTAWPVHRRAALGVGRTFQVLQLFSDLSVYDNLLVATHMQNRTGFFGSILVTPAARMRERAARDRVEAVLRLMELEQYADRAVAGLPFGVLRLIEVARTLVTGARLVCFDEPASGLDSAETEKLIEWFRLLRDIGVTLLVIEHDVSMVVRLCDYIYVLDQGKLISDGSPVTIQSDPRVIASYLGTTVEAAS